MRSLPNPNSPLDQPRHGADLLYKDHLVEDNHRPKLERNTAIMVDAITDDGNDDDDDGNTICTSNTKLQATTMWLLPQMANLLVREIQEENALQREVKKKTLRWYAGRHRSCHNWFQRQSPRN